MKKKQAANLVMVALMALIALAGVLAVGHIRGWFDQNNGEGATLTQIRGIVNLQREGVAYPVEQDTVLRPGDSITCAAGATAKIVTLDGYLVLGEKAGVDVTNPSSFAAEVREGEVFIHTTGTVTVSFDGKEIAFTDTAASLSVRSGAQSISVFAGTVGEAQAGQVLNWVGDSLSVTELSIKSLNDFNMEQIRAANESRVLCFSNEDLERLKTDRLAQMQSQKRATEPGETGPSEAEGELRCTLSIRCDTILDNWDSLDPAKAGYVPSDGWILQTTVAFTQGETVFDVLNRACSDHGIQLEYSWTPLYDSYYVEGIHHLYEFDCGYESGWMYQVNGWFPNYGCSSYTLSDGDQIVWCYTCTGLGADVGAASRR